METNSIKALLDETKWQVSKDSENNGYARDVLVRFIAGIHRDQLPDCIAWLKTYTSTINSGASTTVVNPRTMPEGVWTGTYMGGPIWYQDMSEPGKPSEGTFNLYQALHKGGLGSVIIVTDNGCRYKVTQTFYYKVASVATVPASTSGINYSLSTPIRDEEYGTWTYIIEKREQLTQTIPQYTSSYEGDEVLKRNAFIGVRDGDKDDTGAAITLPTVGTFVPGVINELARSKNDNCTQDIQVAERDAVYQHVEFSYVSAAGTNWFAWGHNGTDAQYNAAVSAIGGLDATTHNRVHKDLNKFGLYDWTIHKIVEWDNTVSGESHQYGQFKKFEFDKIKKDSPDGKRDYHCYRTMVYDWDLAWYASISQAHAALKESLTINGTSYAMAQSPYSTVIHSRGVFGAYYVATATALWTAWTIDET